MRSSSYAVWLIAVTGIFSMGLADCGFVAGQAVYTMKECPPKDFAWPKEIKSETLELQKVDPKADAANTYSCKKLVRYKVRERVDKQILLSKVEWSESDNFVGILRDKTCRMIVSTARVVPNLPKASLEETINKWGASSQEFVKLFLSGTGNKVESSPDKVEFIGGKNEYIEWCERLPLPVIQ